MKAKKHDLATKGFSDIDVAAAIRNYAFFYKIKRSQVRISEVTLSSAGIEGWASANLGFADRVITLHFLGEEANHEETEIECTSAGGSAIKIMIGPQTTVATLRSSLASELQAESDVLQLVLPDARLLTSADESLDEMKVLQLHRNAMRISPSIA